MSMNNGEHNPAVAQNTVLRMEVAALRDALVTATATVRKLTDEAILSTHCIATMMHAYGLDSVELTDAEKRECFEATWLRVRRDIVKFKDKDIGPSIRLTLIPVTDEERKENKAALAAEKRPRIIEP